MEERRGKKKKRKERYEAGKNVELIEKRNVREK